MRLLEDDVVHMMLAVVLKVAFGELSDEWALADVSRCNLEA